MLLQRTAHTYSFHVVLNPRGIERRLIMAAASLSARASKASDTADVEMFKSFLRIKTVHPKPDLDGCITFLRQQAAEIGLTVAVHEFVPGYPVVVLTRVGTQPELPSVVLNCHMDVVPVEADKWNALPAGEDPFTAWESADGKIYARGSQDMKCVGAGYLCALKRMQRETFKRTVHTVWVPDEEVGGSNGMAEFVKSDAFRALKTGVALDEGLAHSDDKYVIYYGERTALWLRFTAVGPVGHASKMPKRTASERLGKLIEKFHHWRVRSEAKLAAKPQLEIGDVTSVNVTHFYAGVTSDGGKTFAYNVIPADGRVVVDTRVSHDEFEAMLRFVDELCAELDLQVEFLNGAGGRPSVPSGISSVQSSWCRLLTQQVSKYCPTVKHAVFPAATDSRYIRGVGIPAFGFSPMRQTDSLLHDHNEYLHRNTFLEGIDVYEDVIRVLSNQGPEADMPAKL